MRRAIDAHHRRDERGFTLAELLVAITILGIIMAAIGAMVVTAFRTTTIVSNRLEGSRAPKLVSTYWVPDVEGATTVVVAGGSGDCPAPSGAISVLVTFTWQQYPSQTGADAPVADPGAATAATWWERTLGTRKQVVRVACTGAVVTSTAVVIPDIGVDGVTVDPVDPASDHFTIDVAVPDRNQADKQYHFSVDATRTVPAEGPPP
ncbi:MAG: prepilin-type N-terminal cleavage/methylation domain-containing protein [Acidimicrobiia bacterium]|nr:prepilin-type N-terminal cleavage/methylation domain-containing protein [Acidimicrobiia bacterium]